MNSRNWSTLGTNRLSLLIFMGKTPNAICMPYFLTSRSFLCATALVTDMEHDECRINMNGLSMKNVVKIERADGLQGVEEKCGDMGQQESNGRDKKDENVNETVPVQMSIKKLAVKVVKKMVKLPLTYSTLLGIIYSLIASRCYL